MAYHTDIIYGKEARAKVSAGADKLAKAVTTTLGPQSGNGAINSYPSPLIIHDGVTIAKSIHLEDPFENMGAQLIKEAATKTNTEGGDGTTTATLLTNVLVQKGIELIEGASDGTIRSRKVKPMELKNRLLEYSDIICEKLTKMARKITTDEEIANIATISAGSKEIGQIVANAIKDIGKTGLILVEESQTDKDNIEIQEGFEFENGFLSPYFATDLIKMIATYEDAYVLLTDQNITVANDLVPIFEKLYESGEKKKPLLIIANDIIGGAIKGMAKTKTDLNYPIIGVMAPDFGERRKMVLEDLAILLGAVVISEDLNMRVADATISDLGRARNILVTQYKTQITPLHPDEEEITQRANDIREQIRLEDNDFRRQRLQERLANLTQKVAIIQVGGGSKSELNERKERFIDAVGATRSAIAEGIVPGGGLALSHIGLSLKSDDLVETLVREMLLSPYTTLLSNSGLNEDDYLFDQPNQGVDVMTGKIVDMFEAGIIDPVKVTKAAVRNAMSIAALILTNNVLINPVQGNETALKKFIKEMISQ